MGLQSKTFELRKEGEPTLQITIRQLPAMQGFELFFQHIGKVLGPSFLQAATIAGEDDIEHLAPVLDGLFRRLSSENVGAIARELLSTATVRAEGSSGGPVLLVDQQSIDGVFNGRMMNLLMAIRYAVEVNYSDFLSEFGDISRVLRKSPPSGPDNQPQGKSGSQSISSTLGHSGDSGQPGAYS